MNLALGRLFAREQLFDKAIQYYHNAIYGLWPGDPDTKRRDTEFELIGLLLQHKAYPQAQAELITTAAACPTIPVCGYEWPSCSPSLRTTSMPWPNSRKCCGPITITRLRSTAPATWLFNWAAIAPLKDICRVRAAERPAKYAGRTGAENCRSGAAGHPFAPRISDAERSRRVRSAFQAAGERLDNCARIKELDLSSRSPSSGLPALKAQWLVSAPRVARLRPPRDGGDLDEIMDLVFEIEQQTQATCGTPDSLDQALLFLSQDRSGVER